MGKLPNYAEDTTGTTPVSQATAASLNMTEASGVAIKTAVQVIDNCITGNEAQVDVITMPNVAQSVSANLKCTEASASATKTAVELIDDVIATHDSAATAKAAQLAAAYDSTKPTAVADGDAVRVLSDSYGRLLAGMEPERFQAAVASADAQAATSVKAKTASKKIYILSIIASSDTALNLQFQDDQATPIVLIENIHLAANGGFCQSFPPEAPLVVTTNQDFDVIASAAGNISVTITGYLAP